MSKRTFDLIVESLKDLYVHTESVETRSEINRAVEELIIVFEKLNL